MWVFIWFIALNFLSFPTTFDFIRLIGCGARQGVPLKQYSNNTQKLPAFCQGGICPKRKTNGNRLIDQQDASEGSIFTGCDCSHVTASNRSGWVATVSCNVSASFVANCLRLFCKEAADWLQLTVATRSDWLLAVTWLQSQPEKVEPSEASWWSTLDRPRLRPPFPRLGIRTLFPFSPT